jgi:hypothetical protein
MAPAISGADQGCTCQGTSLLFIGFPSPKNRPDEPVIVGVKQCAAVVKTQSPPASVHTTSDVGGWLEVAAHQRTGTKGLATCRPRAREIVELSLQTFTHCCSQHRRASSCRVLS